MAETMQGTMTADTSDSAISTRAQYHRAVTLPLRVGDHGQIVDAEGDRVAQSFIASLDFTFAAAPDMLAALKSAVDIIFNSAPQPSHKPALRCNREGGGPLT